ncbi:hypothetical protein WN51_00780 [Melipona quadrifasciata]|uniref:Uncharacterized protein n=1 Tax=Melipona quadrifasciata TaxID=166423 RepID=A0A0M8ZX07_9HYME|nr:hypothetical protein WN51_00780 [Melipona quadrifasciata]
MSSVQCDSEKRRDGRQRTATSTGVKKSRDSPLCPVLLDDWPIISHAVGDARHGTNHSVIAAGSREKPGARVREKPTHFSKNTITSCTRSVATTETDGRSEATR